MIPAFHNDDSDLQEKAAAIREARATAGLADRVGDLQAIIINTEPDRQKMAVSEILGSTGHDIADLFEDDEAITCVLSRESSADILVRSRKGSENPFLVVNRAPKTAAFPNTRLETLVFATPDIARVHAIQKGRGVLFMTDDVQRHEGFLFVQTRPSVFTGNSIGFVQWKGTPRIYRTNGSRSLAWSITKPPRGYLGNIRHIDHIATRLPARDRDAAILEFMTLTNYDFTMAIHVESLNSITNVARLHGAVFAHVFTSGISPYDTDDTAGPTERFAKNYGRRVHHIAFHTESIDDTVQRLAADGQRYLIELVGSRAEGLSQTFTVPYPDTLIVNEYIYRYDGFEGFFTKSNVTQLTAVTG